MSAKSLYFTRIAGLVFAFLLLEWLASKMIARADLPFGLSLVAYIVPTLPVLGIFPLAINYTKNNPVTKLSARRRAPVRRYMVRLGMGLFFYILVLMVSVAALNRFDLSTQVKSILAVLTALPIGWIIWAMGRFIADPDIDEFERMIITRSLLLSTGLTLFFAAIWGFLENFAQAPDFPLYILVPVFFGLFGMVQPFVRRGYK